MKKSILLLLLFVVYQMTHAQIDSLRIKGDTLFITTPNTLLTNHKNYETVNNSFILGSGYSIIRGQDNPLISVDGIPINPIIDRNMPYTEYLGYPHLLGYDIKRVEVSNWIQNYKIVSGHYNNAVSMYTEDILLGQKGISSTLNNFSSIDYREFDNKGYSIVTNYNLTTNWEKFGFRASLTNGFNNNYFGNNGYQRYGGNIKFKLAPSEPFEFTGFVDYTNFQDFKRKDDNDFSGNRIFAYLNANAKIADWASLFGKVSINDSHEDLDRFIANKIILNDQEIYSYLNYKNGFSQVTNYAEIGVQVVKALSQKINITAVGGFTTHTVNRNEDLFIWTGNGSQAESYGGKTKRKTNEQRFFLSTLLLHKNFSFGYNIENNAYSIRWLENFEQLNHTLTGSLYFLNKESGFVRSLGMNAGYAKLSNYKVRSLNTSMSIIGGSYNTPDPDLSFYPRIYIKMVNQSPTNNIDASVFSALLNGRLYIEAGYYSKNYEKYFSHLTIPGYSEFVNLDNYIKDAKSDGIEFLGNVKVIESKNIVWDLSGSYSFNRFEIDAKEDLRPYLNDSTIQNNIFNLVNRLSFKNISFTLGMEGRTGFDMNLSSGISSGRPTDKSPYHIKGVDENGQPLVEVRSLTDLNIPGTKYFTLNHVGVHYNLLDKISWAKELTFGLQYHRTRNLFAFMENVAGYQMQFQKPSFVNSLSLSTKIGF